MFQLMLTFGIVVAALLGLYYTQGAESAIAALPATRSSSRPRRTTRGAGCSWSVIYPGLIFFLGDFFLRIAPLAVPSRQEGPGFSGPAPFVLG